MSNCEVPGTFTELGMEAFKGLTLYITFKKYYELMVKKRILFIFFNPEAWILEEHHSPLKIIQKILNM